MIVKMNKYTMRKIIKILIATLLLVPLSLFIYEEAYAGVGDFYKGEDKYRGFYWFETIQNKERNKLLQFHYPTPQEAVAAIELRKKAMDDARSQMVELGFRADTPPQVLRAAIIKYKKLEAEMHDGAIRLALASEMANFTNPEIANTIELPTNVFANKIKRAEETSTKETTIKEFAKKFDLLLFTSQTCAYSQAFMPVITSFSGEHGFNLESANLDSKEGRIAQSLGITGTPTVVAISKDGKELFEIARGYSTLPELEASVVLASKYSEEQKLKSLQKNRQTKYKNKR